MCHGTDSVLRSSMNKLTEANVIVTTPLSPTIEEEELAIELAGLLGSNFGARDSRTISSLIRRHNVAATIVVGLKEIRLVYNGHSYGFHPNMALHRVAALRSGKKDRLVEAAELKSGDKVLDCTCGLGSDAVVAACAVGENGVVSALEASAVLAAIVRCGFRNYQHKESTMIEAMRRVTVINEDYASILPMLESDWWDIVYFDPMFETTFANTKSIDLVRILGSYDQPSLEIINEARRVARRSVVVKDRLPGKFLNAMDIPIVSNSKRVWYGRLDAS